MMQDPNANFYDVVAEFESYWSGRTIEKGKGYKVFRRWQNFMEPRVYPKGDMKQAHRAYQEFQQWLTTNPSILAGERAGNWTIMGPSTTPTNGGNGRINFVRFHPTNTNIIYAGSPAGGLWITTNGGTSWNTNTDQLSVIGCTDIAIDPATPATMYLATGDGDANDTYSIGILKSTDGGNTWNTTGLTWTVNQGRRISRLLIHPTNTQILLAATSNGIYRTTNGGGAWTQVRTGNFKDMEYKPGDPNTVYACGTTFWKSTDGGATWTQVTSGVPSANVGRLAIATTAANSTYVYMIAARADDNGLLGVYRSTDNGTTFTTRSTTPNYLGYNSNGGDAGGQGWYDLAIAASPTNADVVIVGGINIWRSTNGGTNFTINGHWTGSGAPYVHADIHDLIFLPGNGTTYYAGCDGGVFRTANSGTGWSDISANLAIAQQYKIGLSASNANLLLAGHQDNGTNRYNGTTWAQVYGGDGMDCFIDRTNNNTMYASYVYGDFKRSTNGGGAWTTITTGLTGNGAWVTPWKQDPTTANTLYAGYQQVFRSTNQGTSWTSISSFTNTNTIVELKIAPSNNQVIYVVKANAVFKTTNGGTSWTTITGTLPVASAAITNIDISTTDPNRVYVTFSGYSAANKVFMSTDGGTTWTNYSTGLPNLPVNCIVYQNAANEAVYCGTDVGVYYRDASQPSWIPFFDGLPNVIVNDLEIYYPTSKIRAATFGRGTWQSDLYSPGSQLPTADFTANRQSICVGQTVTFTDLTSGTPTAWNWSFAGGTPATSTQQNPTVTYNTAGTYNVTLTATNANGTNSVTKTAYITVSNQQALPLTEGFETSFVPAGWYNMDAMGDGTVWQATTSASGFSTSTACSVFDNYNNDVSGTRDELWTPKYNFSGYTSITMTFDVAYARYSATYSDTLAVMISTDCGVTWTQVFMKGGTTLATNGGANVTTLFIPTNTQWRTETLNLNTFIGSQNVVIAFQNRGRYGQPIFLDNINISGVMPSLPTASFTGSPTSVCPGQTVNFTNTSTGATTYNWSFPGGTPATSTATNPSVTYATPGTYSVTLTASNGAGTTTTTQTNYITVNANPTATAGSNTPVCTGNSINLTANTVAGASYVWSGPATFSSSLEDPTRPNATTAMAGTYTVTITNASGCTASSTTAVVVNNTPTATATSNSPVCAGQTLTLSTPAVTGATYAWSGPGGYTSTTRNPSRTNATTAMSGTYTVTVTANGCATTSTVSVTVNTAPTATAGSNTPVCSGNAINLTANTVASATYAWTGPNSFTSTLEDPSIASSTTAMSGTYTVTITNGGCSATSTVAVTVNATPTATASSNSPICATQTLTLSTPAVTGATYAWSGPGGYTSTTRNPSRTNATTAMSGTYTVTVTANGCSSTSTVSVAINNTPTATASSNGPVCAGQAIHLNAGNVTGATYAWTGPNGFTSTQQNPGIPSSTAAMAGTYTVTVNNGCSATATTSVTVNPSPVANASNSGAVCEGGTVNLSTTTAGGASYAWSGPGGFTSTSQNPTITGAGISDGGSYTVTVTAAGCSNTSSTVVTINSNPIVGTSGDVAVCSGNSTTLTASGGTSYSWTPTATLSNPSIMNPVATPSGNTTYSVTVTDGNGCTGTAQIVVTVDSQITVSVSGDVSICEGESTPLTANGGSTYSWSPVTGLSSSTGAAINASPVSTTTYTVTGSTGACSNTASVTVTIIPAPASPVITQVGNDLESTPALTYQWLLNGTAISGANGQTYTPTQDGDYDVIITDASGCESMSSSSFTYSSGGSISVEENNSTYLVTLLPNPATGEFYIEITSATDGVFPMEMMNSVGQISLKKDLVLQSGILSRTMINVPELERGVYIIRILVENEIITRRIILM
ncbi:MAG TPA: PKD domain-containing protein [Flavobacteriales bacterium]|nr:PKD domain-containing protein [Flavobacteriales bacterium]